MIPAKRPTPPLKGRSLKSSSVAVAERRTKGAVPPAAVKMFWAEVAMLVAVATPKAGVVKVGEVAKTRSPDPVSSVTAEIRLADEGVARKVATPVPNPDTPVAIGNPVALVKTTAEGVPKAGVIRVGEVPNTSAPLPVSSVIAAERAAEVVGEQPVQLVTVRALKVGEEVLARD